MFFNRLHKIEKGKAIKEAKNISLVLLGCFVLALADALFIIPFKIVNGGVDSLGIILGYYLNPIAGFEVSDIVIAAMQILLWLIGLIFLGKKFSFHTLLGTIAFPAFYSLLLRLDLFHAVGLSALLENHFTASGNADLSSLLVAAIFGGALSGTGVALTYLGDGSTGGFDVLSFLIAKYTSMKQDISGLIMDASLIIVGLCCFRNWELALVGIISAFICAFAIGEIFIVGNGSLLVDIISSKGVEIQAFIHNELGHATTEIPALGGYKKEKRILLHVVIPRSEAKALRDFIASVDPKAFVETMEAKAIHGEGFESFAISTKTRRRILEKYGVNVKKDKSMSLGE